MGCFFLQILFAINQKLKFQVIMRDISLDFELQELLPWVSLLYFASDETFIWTNKMHMTNKFKCQKLTHKSKHMSLPISPFDSMTRLKEHFEWKFYTAWKWMAKQSPVVKLMSLGDTLFSTFDSLISRSGRTGNKEMDARKPWMAG